MWLGKYLATYGGYIMKILLIVIAIIVAILGWFMYGMEKPATVPAPTTSAPVPAPAASAPEAPKAEEKKAPEAPKAEDKKPVILKIKG